MNREKFQNIGPKDFNTITSALCLHTAGVAGSIPAAPTIFSSTYGDTADCHAVPLGAIEPRPVQCVISHTPLRCQRTGLSEKAQNSATSALRLRASRTRTPSEHFLFAPKLHPSAVFGCGQMNDSEERE